MFYYSYEIDGKKKRFLYKEDAIESLKKDLEIMKGMFIYNNLLDGKIGRYLDIETEYDNKSSTGKIRYCPESEEEFDTLRHLYKLSTDVKKDKINMEIPLREYTIELEEVKFEDEIKLKNEKGGLQKNEKTVFRNKTKKRI